METPKITFEQLPAAVAGLYAKIESLEELLRNQQPPTAQDELMTVDEAAKFLHLSVATLYAKVSAMTIPVSKRAGRLYFSKAELIDYVKGGRKKTQAEIQAEASRYVGKKKGGRQYA